MGKSHMKAQLQPRVSLPKRGCKAKPRGSHPSIHPYVSPKGLDPKQVGPGKPLEPRTITLLAAATVAVNRKMTMNRQVAIFLWGEIR